MLFITEIENFSALVQKLTGRNAAEELIERDEYPYNDHGVCGRNRPASADYDPIYLQERRSPTKASGKETGGRSRRQAKEKTEVPINRNSRYTKGISTTMSKKAHRTSSSSASTNKSGDALYNLRGACDTSIMGRGLLISKIEIQEFSVVSTDSERVNAEAAGSTSSDCSAEEPFMIQSDTRSSETDEVMEFFNFTSCEESTGCDHPETSSDNSSSEIEIKYSEEEVLADMNGGTDHGDFLDFVGTFDASDGDDHLDLQIDNFPSLVIPSW
ncbi:hypothetical protein KP509_13G097200 [Ceratopteris richardii]|nr:hypothetical protein KP509_13G097200 [Ceratopteris richardii]